MECELMKRYENGNISIDSFIDKLIKYDMIKTNTELSLYYYDKEEKDYVD